MQIKFFLILTILINYLQQLKITKLTNTSIMESQQFGVHTQNKFSMFIMEDDIEFVESSALAELKEKKKAEKEEKRISKLTPQPAIQQPEPIEQTPTVNKRKY